MKKKQSLKTKDPLDIILNGKTTMPEHPVYSKLKKIDFGKGEKIKVKNPITGNTAIVAISREGTTDEKLAMIMLAPDATSEQKDSMLATYLFERGRENASFLTELMISKGTHIKETQAFKRQIRFDFESFANIISLLFSDIADDIGHRKDAEQALDRLQERLQKGAELITKQREGITDARMREKGFGVYIDKAGKSFSIFDDEIEQVVHDEHKETKNKV